MVGSNYYAQLMYINSDVLEPLCKQHTTTTYTFNEVIKTIPDYTYTLHKKLIARGLINLHHYDRIREVNEGRVTRREVRHYTISPILADWYKSNYVLCDGSGKIAQANRKARGVVNS